MDFIDGQSDDEDAILAQATSASLAQQREENVRRLAKEDEYENEDDEFQAQIEKALRESMKDTNSASAGPSSSKSAVANGPSTTTPIPDSPACVSTTHPASDFLRQRSQLERERLARSRRTNVGPGTSNPSSVSAGKKRSYSESTSEDDSKEKPTKRSATSGSSDQISSTDTANTLSAYGASTASSTLGEKDVYWNYELRPTANLHTQPNDIRNRTKTWRMSEIIGKKDDIIFAIMSSYCWDIGWVYSFFDEKTPVIRIEQPYGDGNAGVKNDLPNWIATRPFLRGGYGSMHVKLMILFYKSGRVRVAIPTANFLDYDWRDIENAVWVQDFPPLTRPTHIPARIPAFASTLSMVLRSLHVPAALKEMLKDFPNLVLQDVDELGRRWDFSNAKVKLIPSMAGKYEGWDKVLKQGTVALMKGIIDIGAHADQTQRKRKGNVQLYLECQGSSVGMYSTQWLNEFYSCASGISPEKWLNKSKAARSKLPFPSIKILFPSLATVDATVLGRPGGGTMFCKQTAWNGTKYPRELFHDSNSKRGPVLMHTKMVLGLWAPKTASTNTLEASLSKGKLTNKGGKDTPIELDDSETDEEEDVKVIEPYAAGWVYVGSHNFTPSAWGTLSGSAFTPSLNITNYELGVLIPLDEKPTVAQRQATEMAGWVRPPRKYILSGPNVDTPWMQDVHI